MTAIARKQIISAEIVGTYLLVFAGCGAIIVNDVYGGVLGHLGVNAVFGLVVMAVIYSLGNVSGAHINPAVTIGFCIAGRITLRDVAPYIAAQCSGAVLAGLSLLVLFPDHASYGATLSTISVEKTFLLEVLISFSLMFVVLNVSTGHQEKGMMAGAAIGGTVTLLGLFAGPVTGASMNPARSIGPAVAALEFRGLWLYLLAPVLGMVLAGPLCKLTQGAECCPGVRSARS